MASLAEYKFTKGGYPQSGDGQNVSCFSNLSVEQAQQQCNSLGDKCAGFSISADGSGNGCFKANTNGGIVNDANYNGYVKSNQDDRNLKASACKSTPNGLSNLNNEINNCTSSTEVKRNNNFAENTFKIQQDIISLSGSVMDSLSMGDTMFGQYGYNDIAKQVKARNEELKYKKEKLVKEVEKGEGIIEKTNRDFQDEYKTVPQPQGKKVLRFVEDWTVAILIISYLFMVIAAMYIFTSMSENKLATFGKLLVGAILLSMFMFMVLFYLT